MLKKYWPQVSLLVSLLLHLLFLMSFSYVLIFHPTPFKEQSPDVFIPSYLSQEDSPQTPAMPQENSQKDQPISDNGIEKPLATPVTKAKAPSSNQPPQQIAISKEEPLHMIGDKNVDNPLLTLIGKSLTKHLFYPKIALDFRVTGVVYIGFLLHPDGHITDIKLVKASGVEVLDKAVVNGVQAISPVHNVASYLKEPKFLVIAIIFGNEKPQR